MSYTYTTLLTALDNWTERDFTQAQKDEFLVNAEAAINLRLQGYQREVTSTLTTDADGVVALPSGFVAIRSVYYGTQPYKWNISGSDLTVTDGASRAFDVTYLSELTPLSASNATNWLVEEQPAAYLFMLQAQARAFNEEWETAQGLEAKANDILDRYSIRNIAAQYGRTGMTLPVRAQ